MSYDEARSLLEKVSIGDEAAFRILYVALSRTIYAFAWKLLRNSPESEDVVVETMHEVWRLADRFEGRSAVKTWVLGIARNKALMKRRDWRTDEDVDDHADSLPDTKADIIEIIASAEAAQRIKECIDKLSDSHRECLHLFFFEDCSIAEVAGLIGVAEGTVKSRLHHAKAGVKRCLEMAARSGRPSTLKVASWMKS